MQAEDFFEECMEEWCFDAVLFPTVHVAELLLDFLEEVGFFMSSDMAHSRTT